MKIRTDGSSGKLGECRERHREDVFYRTEKCPLRQSGFWPCREVQALLIYPPAPLTLPHQGLLKGTLREEAVFNFVQIWSPGCGELALGLGHSGNTSHMTWSMGGPWKLILCFFYTPPPNHPTCPSVSFSKPAKFQRPEPNTAAFLRALIFCPLSVCHCVQISPPLQPTQPTKPLEV